MSTRHAGPGAELSQEKFASSTEFEKGLLGSMVARRCTKLDEQKDKELIWAIHYVSHWGGGMKALAAALLENYPEHFGTLGMVTLGKRGGQNYNAEQTRKIREELPEVESRKFLLRGEVLADVDREVKKARELRRKGAHARALLKMSNAYHEEGASQSRCDQILSEAMACVEQEESELKAAAKNNPTGYPIADFISICRRAAEADLEDSIRRLCLDPAVDPSDFAPWYFAGLVDALRAHLAQWIADRKEGLVKSVITKKVWEIIDYTTRTGQMTLIEGLPRTGKSNAAESSCALHPGRTRLVTVPSGNDDTGFYRAIARALGLGNLAGYKAMEIRERIESVLLTGDLALLVDEGWRLWPLSDPRFGFPKRIDWLMSMSDQGVPVCIISQPDFLRLLKAKQEQGWDSSQFLGRIKYYRLPDQVTNSDLLSIAAFHLPEADDDKLKVITAYARKSVSYLGAIKTIAQQAREIARLDGREMASSEDVDQAMAESVIPCDSNLVRALESKKPIIRRRNMKAPAAAAEPNEPISDETPVPVPRRADLQPDVSGGRANNLIPLITE